MDDDDQLISEEYLDSSDEIDGTEPENSEPTTNFEQPGSSQGCQCCWYKYQCLKNISQKIFNDWNFYFDN